MNSITSDNIKDKIKFKHETCEMNGQTREIKDNEIALYVVVTGKCNAHCKFCEFTGERGTLDPERFKILFDELSKICFITTVHFTGGEPTVELDTVKKCTDYIKQRSKWTTTSVNTNGFKLGDLLEIETVDNVALSRHAISDEDNLEIFGTPTVPSIDRIKNCKHKEKIHLSCNLIKDYIDTEDKILEYLEFSSTIRVNDVGIVTLMNINDYCSKHFVDYPDLSNKESKKFIKTRCFRNIGGETKKECCRCENYLYRASNLGMISMYHRYAIQSKEISNYLVYENGVLKQGFNGEEICRV